MSITTVGSTASLASDDSRMIFDLVDSLSSHGIGNYLDLPQIIVCGDQSSGKSSVLEAISRVPFAVQDGLCTRFATEIILRRQETSALTITIIRPHAHEKVETDGFPTDRTIGDILDSVKMEHMGIIEGNAFSSDILRIEISGPDQPHLTLVDLPGFFEASTTTQSAEDAQMVKKMVISYMKKPRSIILAVVSAANEFPLQQVTQRARKIDPNGTRTLGLITKPDKLDRHSNNEKFYLNLAKNKEVPLSLGWHVLRNRGFNENTVGNDVRDQLEPTFFAQAPWNGLLDSQLGVEALKSRLSRVLHDHILKHIPNVLKEIQSGRDECKRILEQLGEARGSLKEQRDYLFDVSQRFTNLPRDATRGDYSDKFFMENDGEEHNQRLLRAILRKGSGAMHIRGCAHDIDSTSREDYVAHVEEMLETHRGCELPGTFNPLIVGDLFKSQITPCQRIVNDAIMEVVDDADYAINTIVEYVAGEYVANSIKSRITGPAISELRRKLEETAQQLLMPLQEFHPMTQNHYLTENSFLGKKHIFEGHYPGNFQVESLILCLLGSSELMQPSMGTYAASLATDMVEAYYKVALKKFLDDFEVNAVEVCFMRKLPDIFNPIVVATLPDEMIDKIAGESHATTKERHRVQQKMAALSKGEELLRRVCPKPSGPGILCTDKES
ncbi:interferon-induced GTP-binding protein Mx [Apiospora hydei]|uniref:Interferon-induced GTP-binding protein Mx n=1 Tax=Apiospora hydei TaxID=1337664 RepID=A0ABR1VW12_9PEZI